MLHAKALSMTHAGARRTPPLLHVRCASLRWQLSYEPHYLVFEFTHNLLLRLPQAQ